MRMSVAPAAYTLSAVISIPLVKKSVRSLLQTSNSISIRRRRLLICLSFLASSSIQPTTRWNYKPTLVS